MARLLFLAYLGTVIGANWAASHLAPVTVWPAPLLAAPAGVLFVGLAFTLRDLLHKLTGWPVVLLAIGVGSGLSYFVAGPRFALASMVAFGLSELLDLLVYAPMKRRSWVGAVALSNLAALLLDSYLFLKLAFGSLDFFWGQAIGKAWMTTLALVVLVAGRAIAKRRAVA